MKDLDDELMDEEERKMFQVRADKKQRTKESDILKRRMMDLDEEDDKYKEVLGYGI